MGRGEIRLDGRVAVVTGAGRGIGRAHAVLLAQRGAAVVVNDSGSSVVGDGHDPAPADEVVAAIVAGGGSAVANDDSIVTHADAVIQTALDAFGTVDIVVNNAGILVQGAFEQVEPSDVDRLVDVHLRGAFGILRAAWPIMQERGYGRVVNTCSNAGWIGSALQSHYGATKMAMLGLTKCLAQEGAAHGILVNAIAPGAATRMGDEADPALVADFVTILGAEGHRTTPELVAPLAVLLAAEECPVSGELFSVMMGRVARVFLGLTAGYFDPGLSPDGILDHFDEVAATTDFSVPATIADELRQVIAAIHDSPR